jgi:hypothetical protein
MTKRTQRKRPNKEEREQLRMEREKQKLDEFIQSRGTWWKEPHIGGKIFITLILVLIVVMIFMVFTSLILSVLLVVRLQPFKESISSTYSIVLNRSILNSLFSLILLYAMFRAYQLQTAKFEDYTQVERTQTNTGIILFLGFLVWGGHIYFYQAKHFDRSKFISFFQPQQTHNEQVDKLVQLFFKLENVFMVMIMISLLLLVVVVTASSGRLFFPF